MIFVFLSDISLNMIISGSNHVAQMALFHSSFMTEECVYVCMLDLAQSSVSNSNA